MAIIVRAGAGETWCILLGSHIENLRAGERSCCITRDLSPRQKNPPEREGKERRKGEVTFLTRALRSTTQPPGETQGDLVTLIML